MKEIREKGRFRISYRLMLNGVPTWAVLIIAPFKEGDRERLVAGIKAERKNDK